MLRWLVGSVVLLISSNAFAETLTVGAGKQHPNLSAAAAVVKPGDTIEVYDDETYTSGDGPRFRVDGAADKKITVKGIPNASGKRPKLSGGNQWTVIMNASHYVLDGFEITGGAETCVIHKADDITIRNSVVHDCPKHGILGTDEESGSLTLEYVEVYKAGSEKAGDALKHPIYIATDETAFPGSVFRMQHCYVHDAGGGNNVKTRAQRNEIRYNWIENAQYYEVEMVGPDGAATDLAREDSEVVGNVLVKKNTNAYAMRIGGDGTGETKGRYRFLNNTIILTANTGLLRAQDGVESVEFSNNVVYRVGGAIGYILRDDDAAWVGGKQNVIGANNWFPTGSDNIPKGLTGSILGDAPGFTSIDNFDFRLAEGSALIDKGTDSSPPATPPFPNPLAAPEFVPAQRAVPTVGSPPARPKVGVRDIGAFEFGSGDVPGADPGSPSSPSADGGTTDPTASSASDSDSGCGCRSTRARTAGGAIGVAVAIAAIALRRRTKRSR